MSKVDLRLDWCSYEAAKFAVEHWHYSKCLPGGNSVKVGAWENGLYIGSVIFSHGANNNIAKPYGLKQIECVELTRVALNEHTTPVSKILSYSIKMLKTSNPGIRLIVSYADSNQGHHGGIYQATNWIYIGEFATERGIMLNGKLTHRRTVYAKYKTSAFEWLKKNIDPLAEIIDGLPKYKYLFPLDEAMRKQIEPLRKPYPKRGTGETDNAAQTNEQIEGASPIVPL
jgi:hypothetical protein